MTRYLLPAATLAALLPAALAAQEVRVRTIEPSTRMVEVLRLNRPQLGLTLNTESQRGDTLGILVDEVREDSPAAKAGITAGDRLQAVNGVSLRAARADAGEDYYNGVLMRRLQRAMEDVKEGDTVTVRVYRDGRTRELRVAPESPEAFARTLTGTMVRRMDPDRAVLGISTGASRSPRDTLGVFVMSVTADGPAAKAGVIEGDRIAAINGVSLRVSPMDIEDPMIASAKARRLTQELEKVKAGDVVELTVVTAGRSRTLRVTTVKASELPGGGSFGIRITPDGAMGTWPEGFSWVAPTPPAPPVAPAAPLAPALRVAPVAPAPPVPPVPARSTWQRSRTIIL